MCWINFFVDTFQNVINNVTLGKNSYRIGNSHHMYVLEFLEFAKKNYIT